MANVPKAITDLPVASAMGDDDLLVVSQNATTSSIKGELIKGYAQNAVASQVTAAQTAANQAGQSATQAEAARQGAAAAQTAAESAQDAAETARDQSVAAAGTIGDSVEQAQTAAGQASSAKDAAVAAQSAAETAKTAAETASGQAQTAATQAAGSAAAAQTAATQAGDAKTDAETARNEAETSASSAANSASDAESAATEAEQAKTYIENMDMEGETLPAGSSVTVTKTTSPEGNLLFVIGVPQGIQGDKGETGATGATGPQGVSITNATVNEDGDLVITLSSGSPINAGSVIGPQGIQGEVGPTGASVDRIERTSGTGAPGTTDTYTVYLTDGQTGGTFQVYNGSNGTGSGDFMADGSVPMTGDLQMGGHAVTGMADGTDPTDGATVGQLSGKLDSPEGGTAGQVLTKTADGSSWEDAPSGLPDGGTEGQMLYKAADGAAWGDKPVMYVNITMTSETAGTSDKTSSEINDAVEKGYAVYANLEDAVVIPLASKGQSVSVFSISANNNSRAGITMFAVDALGSVSIFETELAVLDSDGKIPYAQLPDMDYVPTSRTVNGQELSQDINLTADNVGARPSTWTPTASDVGAIPNPSGGTTGQVLTKTSTGEEWADAPEGGITQEEADSRYLQLSGGTVTGDLDVEGSVSADIIRRVSNIKRANLDDAWINFIQETDYDAVRIVSGSSTSDPGRAEISVEGNDDNSDDSGKVSRVNILAKQVSISGLVDPTNSTDAANKQYVDTQLSTKLTAPTGTQGQLLGFTADNTVGAVDAPESGLTQEQADARYLQLTGGTIEVDALSTALTLKNTKSTGAVSDVNRSPYLNFETGNGKVVKENVEYDAGYATVSFYDVENDDFVMISGLLDPVYNADAANKAYVDSKAPTSVTVTLTTSGWSSNTQTVTVSGVSATETAQLITPTPAVASQSAYYEAGIMCTGQAANGLTFTCQTVPTSNLTVYVVIQPLN